MLFSSLEFLYLYLPLTLLLYFVTPVRYRNAVLLSSSLVFYGWGEPRYLALMVFTIAVDYAAGLLIGRARGRVRRQRVLLAVTVVINLGLLAFFKYADFILDNLRAIPALAALPRLDIIFLIASTLVTSA